MTEADHNSGDIELVLQTTLANSEEYAPNGKLSFSFRKFFSNWFRTSGSAFYFLFRKNLGVTNIQFPELVSLIRSHTTPVAGNGPIHNLQFMSVSEFKDAITSLVEAFPHDSQTPELRYETISHLYSQIIGQHVVLDCFYGSCAVFVPPQLVLDLESVCAYSGYVHSCGRSLYIRNIEKATTSDFYQMIENYTEHSIGPDKPVFFSVYTHEDFTDYDREKKEYLRHGLDDVKIYVEKFYVGSERLVSVLNEIRQRFGSKLKLPDPGNYSEQRDRLREEENLDPSRTLWLLIDRSSGREVYKAGRRYLICYEQQYINENPFYLFDENKPAWIGPLTIPHTLLSAMINIAEPMRLHKHEVTLADPFVGTGTTWLEAQKYSVLKPEGGDIADITPLLVKDNLDFFLASPDNLDEYERSLEYIAMPPDQRHPPGFLGDVDRSKIDHSYDWVIEFLDEISLDKIPRDLYSFNLNRRAVKKLERRTPLERIFFYLALRTLLRNVGGFERKSAKWEDIYRKEAKVLAVQIGRLKGLKKRQAESKSFDRDYCVLQGSYSQSCAINFSMLADTPDELRSVRVRDARDLREKSYDIIVTDPPYGFNTEDDIHSLAQLYADVIKIMIKALKREGQLIICLPDRSHTGRRLPFFTLKELVIRQVLSIAEQLGREIIVPAYSVPQLSLFRPPYYWESERALRRAILHFRIREL